MANDMPDPFDYFDAEEFGEAALYRDSAFLSEDLWDSPAETSSLLVRGSQFPRYSSVDDRITANQENVELNRQLIRSLRGIQPSLKGQELESVRSVIRALSTCQDRVLYFQEFKDGVLPMLSMCRNRACHNCHGTRTNYRYRRRIESHLSSNQLGVYLGSLSLPYSYLSLIDQLQLLKSTFAEFRKSSLWVNHVEDWVYVEEIEHQMHFLPHIHVLLWTNEPLVMVDGLLGLEPETHDFAPAWEAAYDVVQVDYGESRPLGPRNTDWRLVWPFGGDTPRRIAEYLTKGSFRGTDTMASLEPMLQAAAISAMYRRRMFEASRSMGNNAVPIPRQERLSNEEVWSALQRNQHGHSMTPEQTRLLRKLDAHPLQAQAVKEALGIVKVSPDPNRRPL